MGDDAQLAGRALPDDSDTSPTTSRQHHHFSSRSPTKTRGKPQQQSFSGDDGPALASPTSANENNGDDNDRARAGTKRACNECRQQNADSIRSYRLRCDVVRDPFAACSRCKRYNIDCRIDSNFKRVGKRKRNAEMESEIAELRAQITTLKQQKTANRRAGDEIVVKDEAQKESASGLDPRLRHLDSPLGQYLGSHEAVDSLLDLKSGGELRRSPNAVVRSSQRLHDVVLTAEEIDEYFAIYWSCYHPFHPILNPKLTPQRYLDTSRLLFWVIISVASRKHNPKIFKSLSGALNNLLWATIADVPQNYNVIKALCILCAWPLPISSTTADPTLMAAGLMMQIAMQIGLHRPGHAQDFSKLRVELREGELKDRLKTWAACNIVAQNVGTGYGQPPITQYDWTLTAAGMQEAGFKLPGEINARLRIEIFVDKVTKTLYQNRSDSVGLIPQKMKAQAMTTLAKELDELQQMLKAHLNDINILHLRAAWVHLRLAVLFDPPTTDTYKQDLDNLWQAVRNFLEFAFEINVPPGCAIKYATNYLFQILLASGFVLLKLLNSFFTHMIDIDYGKSLFAQTIKTLREISVLHNDLPMRLAEVLAQLWQSGGAGDAGSPGWDGNFNDSLQLKVTCRMSMSLIYDSTWRWRDQFQAKGKDSLETALENPVNVENISAPPLAASSVTRPPLSTTRTIAAETPATSQALASRTNAFDAMLAPPSVGTGRSPSPGLMSGDFSWATDEWSNDVFDPLAWMLDGVLGDVPFMPGLDGGSGY